MVRIGFKLVTQILYMPADQTEIGCFQGIAPHLLQQLLAGEDFASMIHKVMNKIKLGGGQLYRLLSYAHRMGAQV